MPNPTKTCGHQTTCRENFGKYPTTKETLPKMMHPAIFQPRHAMHVRKETSKRGLKTLPDPLIAQDPFPLLFRTTGKKHLYMYIETFLRRRTTEDINGWKGNETPPP